MLPLRSGGSFVAVLQLERERRRDEIVPTSDVGKQFASSLLFKKLVIGLDVPATRAAGTLHDRCDGERQALPLEHLVVLKHLDHAWHTLPLPARPHSESMLVNRLPIALRWRCDGLVVASRKLNHECSGAPKYQPPPGTSDEIAPLVVVLLLPLVDDRSCLPLRE
jgi:hypothetical protein